MKIVNICMTAYLDGWGYQDNLLPDYEAKAGHDVIVIAQSGHFPKFMSGKAIDEIKQKGNDYYYGKVHIYRIKAFLNTSGQAFLCTGIYRHLKKEQPDVIFHHGINSSSLLVCVLYKALHPKTTLFVDNHADSINESKHKLWNNLVLHGLLRGIVLLTSRYVSKYYGVTPGRCTYLHDMFGAPKEKIELLPIGGDTDLIESIKETREELRNKYNLPKISIIICSGGKMGKEKGTDHLISAFSKLRIKNPGIQLLLFGKFLDKETEALASNTDGVFCMGWCDRTKTLELLKLSDIAIWPIHHTTLIEDAVALALPVIVRRTSNTSHLVSTNGVFVNTGSEEEIINAIDQILSDYDAYKRNAEKVKDKFSYKNIVRIIEKDCKH